MLDRLRTAPREWDGAFQSVPEKDRDGYVKDLICLAVFASRMAGYFNYRQLGHEHAAAVRNSNKSANAARKALGFTYPDDLHF